MERMTPGLCLVGDGGAGYYRSEKELILVPRTREPGPECKPQSPWAVGARKDYGSLRSESEPQRLLLKDK